MLDTNVVVSALVWGGLPHRLIEAAAVAGDTELVVSGDRHLLGLGNHQGIAIVDATEAVRRLAAAR